MNLKSCIALVNNWEVKSFAIKLSSAHIEEVVNILAVKCNKESFGDAT